MICISCLPTVADCGCFSLRQTHLAMIFGARLRSVSVVDAEIQKVEFLSSSLYISATATDKGVIQKSKDAAVIGLSV